jgi:hypothetical protein
LHLFHRNDLDDHMTKCVDAEHYLKPRIRPTEQKGDLNVPTYSHRSACSPEVEDWDEGNILHTEKEKRFSLIFDKLLQFLKIFPSLKKIRF